MPFYPIRILPTTSLPSLASDSHGNLFMAEIDSKEQIFIRISMDLGETWGAEIPVTNATSAHKPAVASVGDNLLIAWAANDGSDRLFYTVSLDGGRSFNPIQPLDDAFTRHAPNMIGGANGIASFISLNGQVEMVILP